MDTPVPSLPPPLSWGAAADGADGAGGAAEGGEAALRDKLRGFAAGRLSGARFCRCLHRSLAGLDVEHQALTKIWRQPISLFDAKAAAAATDKGAQVWAVAAAREAARLVGEASVLGDRAERYEAQLLVAQREGRAVARVPLLWLLQRLEHVAGEMRAHRPRLEQAREALDEAVEAVGPQQADLAASGSAAPSAAATKSRWPEFERPAESQDFPEVILQPLGRRLQDPWSNLTLDALDLAMDLVVAACRALRIVPPVGHALDIPAEVAPERPSLWVAVLETAVDGGRHCLHQLGTGLGLHKALGMPKITIGYWRMRGLAAPLRMMCAYARVECEDIKYDIRQSKSGKWIAPEWEKGHKPDLKEKNPFVELPYLINHRTGELVTLSNAVSLYLGGLLGLSGATERMRTVNEQLLFHVHTSWMEVRALVYPSRKSRRDVPFQEQLVAYFDKVLPLVYEKLESCLMRCGTGFLVGWLPCSADFHAWEFLDQHELMARAHSIPSPLADFELLEAYHGRFRALPRMQSYFESDDARLPVNNKTALFK